MKPKGKPSAPEKNKKKKARRSLASEPGDTEEMSHVLLSSRFFGAYVHDFEGNFLDANDAALDMLGYSRGEIRSLHLDALLLEEDVPKARQALEEIRSTGRQRKLTRYKLKKKKGGVLWVDTEGFLVYRQGSPHAVQGIAIDVTDQVRAEKEVREYQEHLEELVEERTSSLEIANDRLRLEISERHKVEETLDESEGRFKRLAENIRDMIWITDAEGRLLYVNQAVERILGFPPEEAVGMPVERYFTKDSVEKTAEWIVEAETAVPRRNSYHGEVECLHKNGRAVPCEVNVTILRDQKGRVIGYEGVTRDISRRKQAEEAMRKLNVELEQKVKERTEELEKAYGELKRLDRTKDEFLALVSHELRTPLTSIRSFSEILLRYESEPEARKEFLTIIKSESERLTRLINDLLDFSKIEAGAVIWHDEFVSVEEIVRDAAKAVHRLLEEKNLRFSLEMSPDIPLVFADRDRIQQVVTNLLSNAIKFSLEGGKVRVQIEQLQGKRFRETSRWVRVSVQDQGIGIEEKDFEIVFQRFRQVYEDMSGNKPRGTGLGLPICKEIITHYGGNIWVESEKGKGSSFHFTLPESTQPNKG